MTTTEASRPATSVAKAAALAYVLPALAFGIPTPLGLDLEWEDDGDDCRVTGEVLVADARLQIDGRGTRS